MEILNFRTEAPIFNFFSYSEKIFREFVTDRSSQ